MEKISSNWIIVVQLCPTLQPYGHSTPGLSTLHCLPEFAQTHDRWVVDAIQPFYPPSPLSPPALNLSQHQGIVQGVSSLMIRGTKSDCLKHRDWPRYCSGSHKLEEICFSYKVGGPILKPSLTLTLTMMSPDTLALKPMGKLV